MPSNARWRRFKIVEDPAVPPVPPVAPVTPAAVPPVLPVAPAVPPVAPAVPPVAPVVAPASPTSSSATPPANPAASPVDVPDRSEEIIGGLKNALDRGETFEKAKQSFINSGYKPEEIELAIQKVPQISSRISKPLSTEVPVEKKKFGKPKVPDTPPALPSTSESTVVSSLESPSVSKQSKPTSSGLVIALVIMGILVLAGAAYLGLNWDQFF
jgi:hypothetical protein